MSYTPTHRLHLVVASVLCMLAVPGCGFGTGGVVAALGGGSGNGATNAPSTPAGLVVLDNQASPARIRIVLTDAEADLATVEFFYAVPGDAGAGRRLEQLDSNPVTLSTSREGVVHELPWNFSQEVGLPDDGSLVAGVTLTARVRGGVTQTTVTDLGNDAPELSDVAVPLQQITGVVPVSFRVRDTSGDPVDIEVEFTTDAPGPDEVWQRARPGGGGVSVDEPAFRGVIAPSGGVGLTFFWDTDSRDAQGEPLGDLVDLEVAARLRFRAVDPAGDANVLESGAFTVDNNDEPIVQLGDAAFVLSADRRRGIPIEYRVIDEEGDPVHVVFQWRRDSEPAFPPLTAGTRAEFEALLADRDSVTALHLCTSFDNVVTGSAVPIDATHVRLPELGREFAWIQARGVAGLRLQLLRSRAPAGLAASWAANGLVAPRAALPLGDGRTALVLDAQGGGAKVSEVDLESGVAVRVLATGIAGLPRTMALERAGRSVLVVSDPGGGLQLTRVDLQGGAVTLVAPGALAGGPANPIDAIAPLGDDAALVTESGAQAQSLWRLDWGAAGPRATRLLPGLAHASAVVVDSGAERAWIAERDAPVTGGTGRIVAVDLDHGTVTPVVATPPVAGQPAFPRPLALALARDGTRLVALCELPGGARELRVLGLGVTPTPVFALGAVPAGSVAVASGPDDLLLVARAQAGAADLIVSGGLQQMRSIAAYDTVTGVIEVSAPFDPPLRPGQSWRIGTDPFRDPVRGSSGAGAAGTFLWNSGDVEGGGSVFVRALCLDNEPGTGAVTTQARVVSAGLSVAPVSVSAPSVASTPVAIDLDRDGATDLVYRSGNNIQILYRAVGSLQYTAATVVLPSGHAGQQVAAADLNGDGRPDLACTTANSGNGTDNVVVFLQSQPRTFVAAAGASVPTIGSQTPAVLVIADLDGDGVAELATKNGVALRVFRQQGAAGAYVQATSRSRAAFADFLGVADLDADGDGDLFSVEQNALVVYTNGGGLVFTERQALTGALVRAAGAGDFDGDGRIDMLAVGTPGGGELLLQHTPGVFASTPLSLRAPFGVAIADLDGDGDQDFAVANDSSLFEQADVSVYYRDATGAFVAQPPLLLSSSITPAVFAADVDANRGVDLVEFEPFGGLNLLIYRNASQPTFGPDFPVAKPLGTDRVDVADFDGDGRVDVVYNSPDGFTISRQTSPGVFVDQPQIAVPGTSALAVADLDGDGAPELAFARQPAEIVLFGRGAQGGYVLRDTLSMGAGSNPRDMVAADVDGDGGQDLVVTSAATDALQVFYQGVGGSFAAPRVIPLPTGGAARVPVTVGAADLDRDGFIDLVTSAFGTGDIEVLFQDAAGNFTRAPQGALTAGGSVTWRYMSIADLDGDGLLDLFGGSELVPVTVVFQVSPRVFGAEIFLPASTEGRVVPADFDGDGDLDLATNDGDVFLQIAPRVFVKQPRLPLTGPFEIQILSDMKAADLDADGDIDLVIKSRQTLHYFFNGH